MPATTTERKEPTWKILILIQGDYSIHLGKVTRVYSPETREFISGLNTEVKWRSDSGPCDAFATNELQHVPYRDQAMGASRAWAWSVRPSIDVCYIAGLPLTNEVIIVPNILHHSGGPLTNSRFNYHDISCQGPLRGFLLGGPYHSLLLAGQHTADRCFNIFLKKGLI